MAGCRGGGTRERVVEGLVEDLLLSDFALGKATPGFILTSYWMIGCELKFLLVAGG